MYTPKLMLLIFNFTLVVTSIIFLCRGLSSRTPKKLKYLEDALDVKYFSKIFIIGGAVVLGIALLGFWGADTENRIGLITYKILLYFTIGAQAVLVCYFSLNSNTVREQTQNQLKEWIEDHHHRNGTSRLDTVQTYLKCCEITQNVINSTTKIPASCCPLDLKFRDDQCDERTTFNTTCVKTGSERFQMRTMNDVSFLFRTIAPQVAAVLFSDMVADKILLLENLMQGKLS